MGMVCFRSQDQDLKPDPQTTFFDLKANDITGRRIDFYIYKNRSAFLVVNVANKCSMAKDNYKVLNELYAQYRDHGLEIMVFPCNQFGGNETQKEEDLITEIRQKFQVKFTVFEKVQVNGPNTHPVYKYLRSQPLLINDQTGKSKKIPSNFTICLLSKEGKLFRCFKPSKDFDELKKSLKRTLTKERLSTKKMISFQEIK